MKQILFLLLLSFSISAQVKGVVKDSISGKPIAYAVVIYENSKIGVNTDENGKFELPKNDAIQNIEISNLGYNDEESNVYSIYKNKASLLNTNNEFSTKQPNLSLQLTLTNKN